MWAEMLQPLQFCFDRVFTYRSTALPEDWVPNQNWAQVKPTKLLFNKGERLGNVSIGLLR